MNPFSENTAVTVTALGEVRLIEKIKSWLGGVTADSPRGMGDDCAVLPTTAFPHRLVTTDSVIWQRHFDASVSPENVGRKLINRNLSDIAAMGGVPSDAVLSLVMGADVSVVWLENFFKGVTETCRAHALELAGGDIAGVANGFFCATLALTGFAEKTMLRQGARVGDTLLVTGTLGGSLLGKHFSFTPRLREGAWLAAHPAVRAGMDITDGLAKDIPAMLGDGTAAALNLDAIPISDDARRMSDGDKISPLAHALGDGEDYELLIAADTAALPSLLAEWRKEFPALALTPIGVVTRAPSPAESKKILDAENGQPLGDALRGYSHF